MYDELFDELKNLHDGRESVCDAIKAHGLPVIIFGANWMARHTKNILSAFGVEVAGFAVDAEYFQPNKTFMGLPVRNFAELRTQADKYVFVLGMNSDWLDGDRSWEFMHDAGITRYALLDNEYEAIDQNFIAQHRADLEDVFGIVADDFSRQTLSAYLKAMITWNPAELWQVFRRGVYFNELTERARGGVFVDCGAYRGDTVERFINWSGGRYERVIAFEPSADNFPVLENFVRGKGYKNVSLFNCGVWDKKGRLSFESVDAAYSAVSESGNTSIAVEKLDDVIGNEHIDFLKLTVEGSELNALRGAVELIKRQKPILAVSVFQKTNNVITIPQFVKNLDVGYKIYLRKHSRFSIGELILYAVPED